ncbi:DUF2958 domain-containing protein [Asticcacaulis sp. SL142]|uniref:DUF2958 domain-containing protein n=1 Tax=Asticcacaulis sp. SL142 TaxID=2995155 RepID=UPI00226CA1E1|nr:DUF2958 domain-containing protein [Asticcacaulis sp. SL142]WAC49783.1 DUF2958 domain-containing protein [Asticcacaulis sp. SL142]
MILLTPEIRARLLANGAAETEADHVPVVKFFDPCGAATWLVTELDSDGDTLFGLADLGFGFPEPGSFSLSEIEAVRLSFGLGIERDLYFVARFPLSVYAEAARRAGGIVEDTDRLTAVSVALKGTPDPEIPPVGG